MNTSLDGLVRAQFGIIDGLRRLQGDAVAVLGLGPDECAYATIASGPDYRLRDYGGRDKSRSVFIIPAPIKRPYIWDLIPSVSAIRYCLREGLHVYLLEWTAASRLTSDSGIDGHVQAISDCVAKISELSSGNKPLMMGHSLGGTLAAIYAAGSPESIGCLVLLGAPLCFTAKTSQFRDAVVAVAPSDFLDAEPFPGSLLSLVSAFASPALFVWDRLMDGALSLVDPYAFDTHARVERWSLDEVPLPGKLVHEIVEQLYRDNCLCRGSLKVNGVPVGPSTLSTPTLAVVNTADEIAPLGSVKPFLEAMATKDVKMIEYSGERGICFQHLGILLGRQAYARLWPKIIGWINAHAQLDHLASTA